MKKDINIEKYVTKSDVADKEEAIVEDDYVVKSIGGFGPWQAIVTIMAALSRFIALWNVMSILFLTSTTEFRCANFKGNQSIGADVENSTCYENCEQYEYFQDIFETNLISNFELICGREWLASFTQTVLMFGLLVGVSVFGWISDRFGRSNALILSGLMNIIFMFAAPFSTSYWMFTCLRFFVGVASGGVMAITAVFTLEIVGPKYREVVGIIAVTPDGMAEGTLAGFAYFTKTWTQYLLSVSVVSAFIVAILLFLPETPRWLMANGKADKTLVLMTKAAKLNKRSVDGIKENVDKSIEDLKVKKTNAPHLTYCDLFRTRQLAIITTSSFVVWFVVGFAYYGINQYISVLGSNLYVVVAILGFIQTSTCPLSIVINKVFGRKASTMGCLLTVGISMVILIFLPEQTWMSSVFGFIGLLGGTTAFSVVYIYATELYPTPIRNMGFSFSSAGSKLGAMVAPFVANIRPHWVASLIFAVLPFIAVGFCILLPETRGRKLQDTIDE